MMRRKVWRFMGQTLLSIIADGRCHPRGVTK
jgi:hypothetical protein